MRGSYLASDSSSDTSCCVGSLYNNGIAAKECVGHSGLKSKLALETYHGARGLKTGVQGCERRLDQSKF